MKKQIKFLFDNYSSSEIRDYYETTKELDSEDTIRKVGLAVAREAKERGIVSHDQEISDERALGIYVSSEKITDAETGWQESGFGIRYSINNDGSVRALSGYEPLQHDWRLAEVEELVSEGYIQGNASKLIIVLPTGLGATPQDIFDWLSFIANTLEVVREASVVSRKIKSFVTDRKSRKISKQWQENGIYYPEQLRGFIDTKGEWKLSEVKRRLRLNEEYAFKLLVSLGLEPINNTWRLTHSKRSIGNRKRWIRNEEEYRKTTEIIE